MSALASAIQSTPITLHYVLTFLLCSLLVRIVYVLTRIWLHRLHLLPLRVDAVRHGDVTASEKRQQQASVSSNSTVSIRTMIILGSGGHTGEMLSVVSCMDLQQKYSPTIFVAASNDTTSIPRVKQMLVEQYSDDKDQTQTNALHDPIKHNDVNDMNGNASTATQRKQAPPSKSAFSFHTIHRSRNVGQSYVTSIASTLRALYEAIALVYYTRPSLILLNGPGTALPICYVALLYQMVLLRNVQICYIESYCRVTSLSLTGWLLYPFVTRFIVQWPQLHRKLPKHTVTLAEHIM